MKLWGKTTLGAGRAGLHVWGCLPGRLRLMGGMCRAAGRSGLKKCQPMPFLIQIYLYEFQLNLCIFVD